MPGYHHQRTWRGGLWLALAVLLVTLAACAETLSPSPTAPPPTTPPPETEAPPEPVVLEPAPGRLVISELLPGVPGNNNAEFVELYNAGTEPVNLRGWSLWYRLAEGQEEQRVYRWSLPADVPGYGHYLLVREGQDVGVVPDAVYTTPLYERKGGLVLRDADGERVDALGWGPDAPADFSEGAPAPFPTEGGSLERQPGGEEGNALDTDDNAADFFVSARPDPQSSGSPIAPLLPERLFIAATAPLTITPGAAFDLEVMVHNHTGIDVSGGTVVVPVPEGFAVLGAPPAAEVDELRVAWPLPALEDGGVASWTLTLRGPWRYGTVFLGGSYVESPDWPLRIYGALLPIAVGGGAIPVGTARALVGETVTVEGVATMYTGGFYAGSTGTKFYLEDESGGIQVYCPDGRDWVHVQVGDRVRVTGEIEVYRDALEIIPGTYPDDVTVLAKGGAPPEPLPASVGEVTSDEALLGRLVVIQGTVTRFEEFSYSYEMDLMDEHGNVALIYLEKDTYVNPEFVEVGKQYRITGISELYSTLWQVKPRVEGDFVRVFPPELMLDVMAQNSVQPGGTITYTLTAYNHTAEALSNVRIVAVPPSGATSVAVLDGGSREGAAALWDVPALEPGGGSASVRLTAGVSPQAEEPVVLPEAVVTADGWPDEVFSAPWRTFVGSGLPIWAVQGTGTTSPYVRSIATVEGLVTGIFPELGGFWIQSPEPDDDPATSEGLFVLAADPDAVALGLGDRVQVTGKIRERSGETLIYLQSVEDLVPVSAGEALPEPVELAPPASESRAYYEALEGMLVSVAAPAVAVAPTSKYGEYALVQPSWGITRVMRGGPSDLLIFVDDGSAMTHLDRATLPYAVKTGDRVGGLLGPLAFTYENYKIQPITIPTVITAAGTLPALEPAGPDAVSIATFNVENFFDIVDPHPSDPPRPGLAEYRLKLAKTAATVEAMGAPTVVGFQEIEDLGVLEDLAEHETLAPYGYVPALIEGFDSRGIDVGYLVRGDRATLEGASQHPAPEGLTSRPPLLITVTAHLESGDRTLYVLNNHFTSMAGGELATEPRRTAQAAWNAALVARWQAQDPDAMVVVLGDLNAFYDSGPLDALRDGGLRHVYELVEPEIPYTYIFQGESETLDHILVTPALYAHLARVEALHVNADFPPAVPGDPSPLRTSDHDPLVAVFDFGAGE